MLLLARVCIYQLWKVVSAIFVLVKEVPLGVGVVFSWAKYMMVACI